VLAWESGRHGITWLTQFRVVLRTQSMHSLAITAPLLGSTGSVTSIAQANLRGAAHALN